MNDNLGFDISLNEHPHCRAGLEGSPKVVHFGLNIQREDAYNRFSMGVQGIAGGTVAYAAWPEVQTLSKGDNMDIEVIDRNYDAPTYFHSSQRELGEIIFGKSSMASLMQWGKELLGSHQASSVSSVSACEGESIGVAVSLNGELLCRAGFEGYPSRLHIDLYAVRTVGQSMDEARLMIGGTEGATIKQVKWAAQSLQLGDQIRVEIISAPFDHPESYHDTQINLAPDGEGWLHQSLQDLLGRGN
jgi:hypothetical protein